MCDRPRRDLGVWQAVAPRIDGAYSNFLQDEDEEQIRAAYPPETAE